MPSSLTPPSILVTRPEPFAGRLADEIAQMGASPFLEPMLSIVPVQSPCPWGQEAAQNAHAAVLVTSQSAFLGLAGRGDFPRALLGLPCYAVGPATARAARAFGFEKVTAAQGTGASLAALLNAEGAVGRAFLHLAGEHRSLTLEETMVSSGATFEVWTTYRAQARASFSPELQKKLAARSFEAALFYSPRSARVFCDLVARHALGSCCEGLTAIGLSEAVASVLSSLAGLRLVVAPAPQEAAVLSSLKAFLAKSPDAFFHHPRIS